MPRCLLCQNDKNFKKLISYMPSNQQQCRVLECVECGHIFQDPIPLVTLDSRTMDSPEGQEMHGSKFLKWLQEYGVIRREINYVKKFLKKEQPKLLDIGCGSGWTTHIWKQCDFLCYGIEPSEISVKVAKEKYGIEILGGHIESIQLDRKFDIVILRHVLEHIEEPFPVLEKIKSLLNENGILLIVIPNINSIGRYIFKAKWEWILPWHLHFYFPRTMKILLNKTGFNVLKLYQMPSPFWYPQSFRNIIESRPVILKIWDQIPMIIKMMIFSPLIFLGCILNLNDNMTILAQKKIRIARL